MNTMSYVNEFQKIIHLSDKMLQNAQSEEWEAVTSIENERKELLAAFFAKPMKLAKGQLADGIQSILKKDREIVKLGASKREQLRTALQKISRGKDAVHAYSAVG